MCERTEQDDAEPASEVAPDRPGNDEPVTKLSVVGAKKYQIRDAGEQWFFRVRECPTAGWTIASPGIAEEILKQLEATGDLAAHHEHADSGGASLTAVALDEFETSSGMLVGVI